jgi:hypothetical protein
MARKSKTQPARVAQIQQTDAVFTQLLITARRIYGDPAVSSGKAGRTR